MVRGHVLPYDVERLIIFYSARDRSTLCSLSLVSKDFSHDVDPFLWQTVWLPREESVLLMLAACEAICRIPRRAECIRKLIYGVDLDVPPLLNEAYGSLEASYPPKLHGNPVVEMDRALKALVNLEELHFNVHHFRTFPENVSFSSLLDSLVQSSYWPVRYLPASTPSLLPRLRGDYKIRAPLKVVLKQANMKTIPEPIFHVTPGSPSEWEFFHSATAIMGGFVFLRQLLPFRPLIREITFTHVYSGTSGINLTKIFEFFDLSIEHFAFPLDRLDGEGIFDYFQSASRNGSKTIQSLSFRPHAAKQFMARASSDNSADVTVDEIEGLDNPSGAFCVQGLVKLIRKRDGERDSWGLARP